MDALYEARQAWSQATLTDASYASLFQGFLPDAFDEVMWRLQVAVTEFLDQRIGELLAFFAETDGGSWS